MPTLRPWMTKVLTLLVLVIGYVLHKEWIPPGATFHLGPVGPISVAGLVNDFMILMAAIGISGPQLSPKLAALMGNPSHKPPAPPAA